MMPYQQTTSREAWPHAVVLGIGYASHAQSAGLEDFIATMMAGSGIRQLSCIATLPKPAMPPFITRLAQQCGGVPRVPYSPAQLEKQTARLAHPSATVYRAVGCHGVAEAAALCAAGCQGRLVLAKTARNGITVALAVGKSA